MSEIRCYADSGWINVKDRLPDDESVVLGYLEPDVILMRCIKPPTAKGRLWFSPDHVYQYAPSHWQPLPPPPPRESSFEKFWDGLGSWKNKLGSEWTDEFGSMPVNKEAARKIWNIAVEAVGSPDFVP